MVPPGSQAVQIPSAYPGCGGEQSAAMGSVQEAAPGGGAGGLGLYPTIKNDFVAPALGSAGGFYSDFAAAWAVSGASAWIAPIGHVTITGVAGTLVSYVNVNIPQGTLIRAGAIILLSPPALSAGSGSNNSTPVDANALDRIGGFLESQARHLPAGANGALLRSSNGRWLASPGGIYSPLAAESDISPSSVRPIPTGSTTVTVNLSLPNLPTPLPSSFGAILTVRLKQSAHNQEVEVKIAGQAIGAVRGTQELDVSTAIIRCVNATPQMTVSREGNCSPFINVYARGYFL